ncbi:MAG: hypothetical protein K6G12_04245 [Lachnospiraceae bacterium]|nr:hypothetical protein [Lachnospiraceae bacterium]
MKIAKNLYVSNKIKHKTIVVAKFRVNRFVPGIFVIRLAYDPDNLEIIRADLFKQPGLRKPDDRPVVAFAANYKDAVDIVIDITQKAYDKYGYPAIKEYISSDDYGSDTRSS